MSIADTDLPPHPVDALLGAPFSERIRLVCRAWASQVNATPFAVDPP